MDGFTAARSHLLQLLEYTGDPFLFTKVGSPWEKTTDQFVLQRRRQTPIELPLAYVESEGCDGKLFDIGSHQITRFRVLRDDYSNSSSLAQLMNFNSDRKSLYGDRNLFHWFLSHNLCYELLSNQTPFSQLYFFDENQELVPLYTEEQIAENKQTYEARQEKEKKERLDQKRVRDSLNIDLQRKRQKTPEHRYFEAGQLEHETFRALREGNFERAQQLIDDGANLERFFYFSPSPQTLLSYACTGTFPMGSIPFLLRNKASATTANFDNALYYYREEAELLELIQAGVPIPNPVLALARASERSHYNLVDYLIKTMGVDVNAFTNGLPLIYMANGNQAMWNYLIDLGAHGALGQPLEKR